MRVALLLPLVMVLVGGAAADSFAAEGDAAAAPANTFENIWFRTATRSTFLAYEARGKLTVGADEVSFQHEGGTLRIPVTSIQRVELGRMSMDIANRWVIVHYAVDGAAAVAGFKPPAFANDEALFLALRGVAREEALLGGFNSAEWVIGNQSGNRDQRITEFVHPGEKIDNWTELLTAQMLRRAAYPAALDDMVAATHQALVKRCPQATMNVIARDVEGPGILYEWTVKDCAGEPDQHEVVRVIYGRYTIFRLAFVAKTAALAPEKREKWIADLKTAKIVVQK